jgi:hypothetical protein
MAEGRIPVELFSNIGLKLNTIAIFIRALLYSLEHNNDILEFLSNFTGGNIRFAVDFITKFIGSANIDSAKIIDIMSNSGRYIVPVHEFWKAALLGEYSYYDPVSSIAINMFDIASPNPNEHFLLPLLLGYLDLNGSHKSKEGFVRTAKLLEEAQNFGFALPSVELALRRANNKNLIETAERITFAEDKSGLFGQMPENFRLSTVGAYHLKRWIGQFAYLDAMSYDTPILEPSSRDEIASHLGSFAIEHRLSRALSFRSYLSGIWAKFHAPTYFDWTKAIDEGRDSFERVRAAVEQRS